MDISLHHAIGRYIDCIYEGTTLFRYRYDPATAENEAPRPIFHPVKSLAGNTLTAYRPWDHPWHQGLSMTCAELSGCNFWGGPTYVRDSGYVMLDNHGKQQHLSWLEVSVPCRLREALRWISSDSTPWIEEERTIEVKNIDATSWTLSLEFQMKNIHTDHLEFGSPTTNGRPDAGYGGLFWRFPRSFYAGTVMAESGDVGESIMGKRSPFLAYQGKHDESATSTTIIVCDDPDNPRYPTQWFIRNGAEPYLSASFMFDKVYILEPGAEARFAYTLHIIDGTPDHSQIVARTEARAKN